MENFGELLPDLIFSTVSAQGFRPTGVLFPLNSYENRVYEIGIEGGDPLVAKFYRPDRWSPQAIAEEHGFVGRLAELEIPVIAPLSLVRSRREAPTLGEVEGFCFALFPKFRGREKAELSLEDLGWLGRLLARMHRAGENFSAPSRMELTPETYGYASLDFLLGQPFIPQELRYALEEMLHQVLEEVEALWDWDAPQLALHGDCHLGNVLWNLQGPHLLDFDDMVRAPAVQDVWMLFSGDENERREAEDAFWEGYEMFRDFDFESFSLVEPLRTLRMIRHAAWIGQRYSEPLFQRTFPYYTERRYWEQFLLSLKEQMALLQGYE